MAHEDKIVAKKKEWKPNKSYDLEALDAIDVSRASTLILGCDPGSRNFGISLVGLVKSKPVVYANSVLMNPVHTLVDYNGATLQFLEELDRWMAHGPAAIVAERFQTRGGMGPLIECVSVMLGVFRCYDKPVKLTIASTWKNKFNRRHDVGSGDRKDTQLSRRYASIRVQPHQLDATLIALHGLEEGLKTVIDYDLEKLIAQVESTSLIGVKRENTRSVERKSKA